MDPAAANHDQNSNDLDYEFSYLEEITPLCAWDNNWLDNYDLELVNQVPQMDPPVVSTVVQKELLSEPEVTYPTSVVREMVNSAVKVVREEVEGQIAALQAQINALQAQIKGTSAGAVPSGTHADTSDDVDISSDRDCGDGGRKPPTRSGLLSLEDI